MPNSFSPLISVIMPVYNGERFLQEAIDSVLCQTFPDFELLIIDDGSTDNTSAILEKYQNEPKIRIFQGRHQGVSAARNLGVSNARGGFVAFIDSDDRYDPNGLEKLLDAIQAHPDCEVVHAYFHSIDENGRVGPKQGLELKPSSTISEGFQLPSSLPYSWDTILSVQFTCSLWAAIFRKSVFEKYGLFRTDLSSWEDYEYFVRIYTHAPLSIWAIPEYTYYYRYNEKSHSKSLSSPESILKSIYCFLSIYDSVFSLSDLPSEVRKKEALYYAKFYRRYIYLIQKQRNTRNIRYIAKLAWQNKSVTPIAWLQIFTLIYIKSFLIKFLYKGAAG